MNRLLTITLMLAFCVYLKAGDAPRASSADQRISVDFTHEKAVTILANVAEFYGLKLSIPDAFSRELRVGDFAYVDLSKEDIWDMTLAGSGYTYEEKGGVLTLVTGSTDAQAVKVLAAQLRAEKKTSEEGWTLLRRVIAIDDSARLVRTKNRLSAILQSKDWTSVELGKAIDAEGPNKALVPTVMSVTPAADAPVAPATTAAHL